MNDNSKDTGTPLSQEELTQAEELQAEIRRKLSFLLADPRTPEIFKEAFMEASLTEGGEEV